MPARVFKFPDPGVSPLQRIAELPVQCLAKIPTGRVVRHSGNFPHVGERHLEVPKPAHQAQRGEMLLCVVAVPVLPSRRPGEDPVPLVEPDCVGTEVGLPAGLQDVHRRLQRLAIPREMMS